MAHKENPQTRKYRACRHELKLIQDPNERVKWTCKLDMTEENPIWQCQLCWLNLCDSCYNQFMNGEIQWDSVYIYQ